MRRTFNVVRLQLINKGTFVWYPLIILAAAVVISIIIYAMIPVDTPKYGGGGQAPLWYFFAIGMSAMTLTFPFSQAMSITRREFFFGTLLTAILGSALMGILFLIGGGIEVATNGYGVNGYVFYLPWLWDAGPLGAFVVYFSLALFFFVLGFTGATIYKSWGSWSCSSWASGWRWCSSASSSWRPGSTCGTTSAPRSWTSGRWDWRCGVSCSPRSSRECRSSRSAGPSPDLPRENTNAATAHPVRSRHRGFRQRIP